MMRRAIYAKLYGLPGEFRDPEKWVFLVGCYNSGTTLLQRLLARHPQVRSMATEGQFYTDQLPVPMKLGLARAWALRPELFRLTEKDDGGIDIARMKRQWQRAARPRQRPVLIEKSPTNAARIRWLNSNFDNSYFVAIVRDPYAVVEGLVRNSWLSVELAAQQWTESNRIMLNDLQQVPRSMLIRYEELAEAPEMLVNRLCEFLKIEKQGIEILDRAFNIHGETGLIRNLNEQSISRLNQGEIQIINDTASDLQLQLGYPIRRSADTAHGSHAAS